MFEKPAALGGGGRRALRAHPQRWLAVLVDNSLPFTLIQLTPTESAGQGESARRFHGFWQNQESRIRALD
jgi:hypothetical protein